MQKKVVFHREALLRLVSMSAFIVLLLFLSDGSPSLIFLFGESTGVWIAFVAMLVAIVVCCLLYAFRGVLDPKTRYRFMGSKGGTLAILGSAITGLSIYSGFPVAIIALGGAVLGFGLSTLGVGWGMEIARRQEASTFRPVIYALIIAGLIKPVLLFLPRPLLATALILLLVASSALPLVLEDVEDAERDERVGTLELVRGMLERSWVIFLGFVLCMSINAFLWGITFTEPLVVRDTPFTHQWASAFGACHSGLLLWLLIRNDSLVRLKLLSLFAPLICVASILIVWFMAVWNEGFSTLIGLDSNLSVFVSSVPVGFSVTTLGLLLALRLGAEAKRGLSLSFALGISISFAVVSFLAFNALQYIGRETGSAVDLTLKISYLAITTIYLVTLAQRSPSTSGGITAERLTEIRERYALSKRETEILALLIQGHSAPYIAEVEFISLNTVKTHMKRLYVKTDVHNKEELLDIIYRKSDNLPIN